MIDVDAVRRDTPGTRNSVHLNSAGSSLMPRPVVDAIAAHLELELQQDGYAAEELADDKIQDAYTAYAELLGTVPNNIALMENATDAWSRAVSSIPLRAGDVILTSENDYISNQIAFMSLAERNGIVVERIPDTEEGGFCPDAAKEMIAAQKPKLVAITHVPTNSGLVQPVELLGDTCRSVGAYYLVDACQSIGQIQLDVKTLRCDFLSASARKFLRGPRGSGVLFVSDRVLDDRLEPLYVDMRGARWLEADRYQPVEGARRFETWEYAYALVVGSGVAVRYALALGMADISAHIEATAASLRQVLSGIGGVRVLDRGQTKCGIVTLDIPGLEHRNVQPILDRHKITATLSMREYAPIDFDAKQASWALRVAPHCYTNEHDLNTLYTAVEDLSDRA